MKKPAIDINADVGEGCGYDAALMSYITSANIAAGYHAGGREILRDTVHLAKQHGVNVGAHPGFRDPDNFGRRELAQTPLEIESLVFDQLQIVSTAAAVEGVRMVHVKPHGALYNMAVRNHAEAAAVVRAVARFDRSLILFAPSCSELCAAAEGAGLRVMGEAFADRAYEPDGSLVARSVPGALIDDVRTVVARAFRMATDGVVTAIDGSVVTLRVNTICVHGDTPGCVELARALAALSGVHPSAE